MTSSSQFFKKLNNHGINFFVGVPDSLLKNFTEFVLEKSKPKNNIIAANEGTAVAIAAGYNISNKKIPLVYLQNSGLGNLINPLLSLTDKKVYKIPMIIMVGWRGEPNKVDEPQHLTQGKTTLDLIKATKKKVQILDGNEKTDIIKLLKAIKITKKEKEPTFLLVKKNTFSPISIKRKKEEKKSLISREIAINEIIQNLNKNSKIVATTGMISRELYEIRKNNNQKNSSDFLVVGSMGHASQIALGMSLKTKKKIICLDGDGAMLMHLGGMTSIGSLNLKNFIHIVLNNKAHDSVGGQPTATINKNVNLCKIASGCGYKNVFGPLKNLYEIKSLLKKIQKKQGPFFVEILIKKGFRKNLGRPKEKPITLKNNFIKNFN